MIFDTPATTNPIDQLKVIGQPADRVDGPRKVSGKAPYAYERHDMVPDPAYGVILGSAIAKGRIISIDPVMPRAPPASSPSLPLTMRASLARPATILRICWRGRR